MRCHLGIIKGVRLLRRSGLEEAIRAYRLPKPLPGLGG